MGRRERTEDRFRKRLRTERERREWSQSDLAQLLCDATGAKWHPTTIAKIEAGDRSVRIDEAVAIAEVLEVPLNSLLGLKTAVENDLAYAMSALQQTVGKSVWDVNAMYNTLRDRWADVLEVEFDGSDTVAAEGTQALDALQVAMDALYKVAPVPLDLSGARIRPDSIERAARDILRRQLEDDAES
jgi:transcriptional regulator with XRE-family HTH domain